MHRRKKSAPLPSWIAGSVRMSHVLAWIFGMLSMRLWQSMTYNTTGPASAPFELAQNAFLLSGNGEPYDVIPLLVLNNNVGAQSLRLTILEAQTRIRFNSTLKTGPMYIYYPSELHDIKGSLEKHAGDLGVEIRAVPNTKSRKDILVSQELWRNMGSITDKVLVLESGTVLCSNPTHSIASFVPQFDWIGPAWDWASDPSNPYHKGGNGCLCIRSPRHMLQVVERTPHDGGAINEDMYFVKHLREWEESGEDRNGVPPPKLPPHDVQQIFGVEVMPSPKGVTPVGIYHLMVTMPYRERQRMLNSCPEAKRLFNAHHDRSCVKFECPVNISQYSIFQWEKRQKEDDFDKCTETCHFYHHPAAAEFRNSTM